MNMTKNNTNLENGHPFVDLGLPSGLLWATCNVGATSPEQAGLYFAWGETVGYTAEQVTRSERLFVEKADGAKEIKQNLTLEQDAAHANLGGKWRMPTEEEFHELIDNCYITWASDYNGTGVAGKLITSKINGNSVFFPAAGCCLNYLTYNVGLDGRYWSASWITLSSAWLFYFYSGNWIVDYDYKWCGFPVRGVCER